MHMLVSYMSYHLHISSGQIKFINAEILYNEMICSVTFAVSSSFVFLVALYVDHQNLPDICVGDIFLRSC
jgi:hypothetical protein